MAEIIFDYEVCLLACARGDHRALHQLYEQDSSRLLGVALRITRNKALAEDIVHDAFIKIWHGARSFDPLRGSARGWVFSVTRHLALDVVRSAGRDVPLDDQYEPMAEPAQTVEFAARSGQIHQCLERLDPTAAPASCTPMWTVTPTAKLRKNSVPLWVPSKPGSNAASPPCGSAWHERQPG